MLFLKELFRSIHFLATVALGLVCWMALNDSNTVYSNLSTWLPQGVLDAAPVLQQKSLDYYVLFIVAGLFIVVFVSWWRSRPGAPGTTKDTGGISVNMRDNNTVQHIGNTIDDRKEKSVRRHRSENGEE